MSNKPIVKIIPVQEALEHFQKATNSEGAFEKARRFAVGDFPKLADNFVEITHTANLQMPYTMRKLFSPNGQGVTGSLMSALKKGTHITHSSPTTQVNPKGYLCEVFVSKGGMTGPCNVLFAVDAINQTNVMVLKTHHKNNKDPNIDRLVEISRSGQASQWNAQATAISSFHDPRTGNLLSVDMLKPHSLSSNTAASSSSSGNMEDDEKALAEMQEMVGRMCVADGVEFPAPKLLFQGKSTLRHTYDVLGAVNPKTLDVGMYKLKRTDDHTYVLAHSVLGMAILGTPCTFAYQGKEEALPTDELGYVLRVPNNVVQKAREDVLKKAHSWESMTAHALEDMHVRLLPGVTNWQLTEDGEHYERDGFVVPADEPFTLNARIGFVMRHYHSEGCAAILSQFKDVWPQPVYNSRDVNAKTGEVRKDARSMVHLLTQNIQKREDQLELLKQLTDEQVINALKEANVEIDEEGNAVLCSQTDAAASSSSSTSEVEDD